jgi:exopolysaccharide biosynthesis polyprenyl glycosylphosphotransferase
MIGVLAEYISVETAALGLLEFILAMLAILCALGVAEHSLSVAHVDLAIGLGFATLLCAACVGLYRPAVCLDRRGPVRLAPTEAAVFSASLLLALSLPRQFSLPAALWLCPILFGWLAISLLIRTGFALLMRGRKLPQRVLVVGDPERAAAVVDLLRNRHAGRFEVLRLPDDGRGLPGNVLRQPRVWGVVIAGDLIDDACAEVLLDSKLRGIRVQRDTSFAERQLGRIDLNAIDRSWFLSAEGFTAGPWSVLFKRALDIIVSAGLLLLTLPLMLFVALAIKLESHGPVLYRQERIGLHGKPFTLLKFRSMTADAEATGSPVWAQVQDPRVTRIGNIIRPLRIDELPQLLNVLHGEMSMVGPRPERPIFVEQLAEIIPFYQGRAYVKPGLTGWAQVNYPYGASVEDAREKLSYDLYYVKNRNFFLDLVILVSTVRVILFREGAR